MKTLYFDCFSGASGNMILGGLIALGVNPSGLESELAKLGISDFRLSFERVDRSGIKAVHVETVYEEAKRHRHLAEILEIISDSGLEAGVRERAARIFERLAEAEAKVHGIDVNRVHFHEVGAMDAIIDVVGACVGFEVLEIERFVCSRIHVGSGFVDIDHGRYPVPPPAVSELLEGIPIYSTELEGELITPTGAAIIATVCQEFGELRDFIPESSGYGAGTREYAGFPNVLRMVVGQQADAGRTETEDLCLLETNLDDSTGEILGYLMEESLAAGALDCWYTPIQMKKNRPAILISILCRLSEKEKLSELLYTETSTIGIRVQTVRRECLAREISVIETEYGPIEVKIARHKGRVVNIKPEFDQIRKKAREAGVELKKVVFEVTAVCAKRYEGARIVGTKSIGGSG
ncbi:MAG: nickel pincer cofactor biosynthesis protein LarC [Acidobacteriota bacterium]|nr:nickel pincer cofactor biosynthesis protein LarC [Acidobacteriota bacterium]